MQETSRIVSAGARFALAAQQKFADTYQPTIPAPSGCTAAYAKGWIFGDHWISTGRSKADTFETPVGWSESRANGFWDRLNHQS